MRDLTFQDTLDILFGSAVLASGGGGYLERAISRIQKNFSKGKKLSVVDLSEIPPDALVASPYYAGALIPEGKVDVMPVKFKNEILRAFELLQNHLGKRLFAVIPIEIGSENTATAIDVAMNFDIYLIDGDTAGRAVPGLQHTTYFIKGIPITPLAIVNRHGEEIIVDETADYFKVESIIRKMVSENTNVVGVSSHPVNAARLKNVVITGTVSAAERLGNVLRNSQKQSNDPVKRLLIAGRGYLLFQGKMRLPAQWREEGGFAVGEYEISGTMEFEGHSYRIWFKNENLISWLDGNQDVTSPDLITVVDRVSGVPITNPRLKMGTEVAVLGFRSPEQWRNSDAIKIIEPRSFGFDLPYIPIEETHKEFSLIRTKGSL